MQTRIRSCVPHDDCDAVELEIRFELAVDDIGGEQQRALPQLRQLLRQPRVQRHAVAIPFLD